MAQQPAQQQRQIAKQQNGSVTTIFTLVNSMIGGAMLTFPVLFREAGMVTGIVVLIISSIVSYKTCRIYVMHLSSADNDIEDSIKRIMGDKWERLFRLITGVYLVLLNIIYLVLIVDQIYNIIYFIMSQAGAEEHIAPKNVTYLVFDRFSKQYLSIIMFPFLLLLTFVKNLSLVIKLASYGIMSVFVYFGFIIFEFSQAVAEGINYDQIRVVGADIGKLAGTSAIAFTVHTVVATIIKSNKIQQHNMRDLKISYGCGLLLYCAIGCMGSLAIWDIDCEQTIINCYIKDKASVLVQITYLYGLSTVFPCFIQVGRSRLLYHFYPTIKRSHFRNFNISFMVASMLCCFLSPYVKLDMAMNLVGSLVCFFFVYYIPTRLHFACLFGMKQNSPPSSIISSQQSMLIEAIESKKEQKLDDRMKCMHAGDENEKFSYSFRIAGYSFLNFIGVLVAIYGIYQVIDAIIHPKSPSV